MASKHKETLYTGGTAELARRVWTHNEGIGSLAAGVAALSPDSDAFVVCLADMPLMAPAHIDKLIAAFDPAESRAICVPVHNGRRGNPVLWSRRYAPEMLTLTGDQGARRLLDTHAESVAEVPVASDAIFADVDTPEALAGL